MHFYAPRFPLFLDLGGLKKCIISYDVQYINKIDAQRHGAFFLGDLQRDTTVGLFIFQIACFLFDRCHPFQALPISRGGACGVG